jgi:hypothetical protein
VVTTVIIILVVLAAITLIWAAVRPTIQSASEQITADCITLEVQAVGCDSDDDNTVSVRRGPGSGTVTGVVFVREGDGQSARVPTTTLLPLETDIISIPASELDLVAGDKINVAGVVGSDNVCDLSIEEPATCADVV